MIRLQVITLCLTQYQRKAPIKKHGEKLLSGSWCQHLGGDIIK